jgi:hypothetical protein
VDDSGALLIYGAAPVVAIGLNQQDGMFPAQNNSGLFLSNQNQQAHENSYGDFDNACGEDGGWDDCHGGEVDEYDCDVVVAPTSSEEMHLATPVKNVGVAVPHNASKKTTRAIKPMKDLFAQLDPHQVVSNSREVRRGRTYKIPSFLLSTAPAGGERLDHLNSTTTRTDNASELIRTGAVPSKGLFDLSLLPVLQLKRKLVRQARMASMRLAAKEVALSSFDMEEVDEEVIKYQNLARNAAVPGGFISLNASHAEDLWAQDYADVDDDFAASGNDEHDDFFASSSAMGDNDAAQLGAIRRQSSSEVMHGGASGDDQWAAGALTEEEELSRRVANVLNEDMNLSKTSSYETMCQKFIDNFNRGANLYAKYVSYS